MSSKREVRNQLKKGSAPVEQIIDILQRRYITLDMRLTEEQVMMQRMVREFAQHEVKPLSAELDAKADPKECLSWDLIKKASKLGLRTLPVPTDYGGGGITDFLTQAIVMEELGAADLGFASIFRSQISLADMMVKLCNKEQKDEFIPKLIEDDTYLLAAGMTEPNHGTDANIPYDAPGSGIETFADRKGDEYIINGTKHFISNGGIAKLYFIYARTNKELPVTKSLSLFLVPYDTPGFSIGSFHDKLGRRLLMNAELVLDDMHIPTRYLVGTENNAWIERKGTGPAGLLHCATILGTLRTCYEEAVEYARNRVQGGKPIIEHPTVAAKLGDMRVKIEAVRRLIWWDCWRWDSQQDYDPKMNWLIKAFTDQVTIDVVMKTIDIFGGMGTDKTMPIQKYVRDGLESLHGFGTGEMNLIKGAPTLT